jgi:3-oxoacid CoA-transferase A subunit
MTLIENRRVAKATLSFTASTRASNRTALEEQNDAGEIIAELLPQGTLAEAIRAGGAGLGGFLTPVGAGTDLAAGKEHRDIDGVLHVLERPLRADAALVYAARADELGNLWYRRTARNFNPAMATAVAYCAAEAGEIVPVGGLEPEDVHTPHLYVDALVARDG